MEKENTITVEEVSQLLEQEGYFDLEFLKKIEVNDDTTYSFFGYSDDYMIIHVIFNKEKNRLSIWDCYVEEDNWVKQSEKVI